MIDALFFGINFLLILLIWRFGWKVVALNKARDDLFEIRDELRDYFIGNEIPLTHASYKQLRDRINNYIRFTEEATLINLMCFSLAIDKNKEIQDIYIRISKEKDKIFENEVIKQFADNVRTKAAETLTVYMVKTSVIGVFLVFLIALLVPIFNALNGVKNIIFIKYKIHFWNKNYLGNLIKMLSMLAVGSLATGTAYSNDIAKSNLSKVEGYCETSSNGNFNLSFPP